MNYQLNIIMMKKNLLFLFSIVLIIGFSACTKTEYRDVVPENPNRSYVVTMASANWVRVSPSLIRYDIPLRDLTEYYLLQGGVAVALSFDNEDSYDVLPSTFEAVAYSINYGIGEISVFAEDPLADSRVTISIPSGNVYAKILLSTSDFFDYNGVYRGPEF
jgi:hypothetical protein